MKGVRRIVRLPDAVAVVADSWWRAKRAAEALRVTWDDGGNGQVSTQTIRRFRARRPRCDAGRRSAAPTATSRPALARAARRIEADYTVPFLAHATMEPQTCTAHVTPDGVEIWVPTQDPSTALATAASPPACPTKKSWCTG